MTVEELMGKILPRMAGTKPVCSIFDAVQIIHSIIVNRLLLKRSNLVQVLMKLDLPKETDAIALPAGYLGMVQRPVLSGKLLSPLNAPVRDELVTPGDTAYYDVIGGMMSFYPPPADDGALTLKLSFKPDPPANLESQIPFQGAFDDVYYQGTFSALINGTAAVADRAFAAVIEAQVDSILALANMDDEQMLADSINYH